VGGLNLGLLLRRGGAGLGVLALVSAWTVPVFAMVATEHQEHWSGSAGADYWAGVVAPWSSRVWAVIGVAILAGWTAGAAPPASIRGQSVTTGLMFGLMGSFVYLVASIPAWIWMIRLGGGGASGVTASAMWAWAPLALGAVAAGVLRRGVGQAGAALGGAAVGAIGLCVCWGGFP